jgi:hypothetical protein
MLRALCALQSIDALAEALEEFSGGVVVISHDARLLSRICDDAGARRLGAGHVLNGFPWPCLCASMPCYINQWPAMGSSGCRSVLVVTTCHRMSV